MSEKSCDTCLYQGPFNTDECYAEQCDEGLSGWRLKDTGRTITGTKIEKTVVVPDLKPGEIFYHAAPKSVPFSLDKLIDDHWQYNKGLMGYCLPYGVDGWETDDILRLVEFAYKQSGKHFWKHCKEHYDIKEAE